MYPFLFRFLRLILFLCRLLLFLGFQTAQGMPSFKNAPLDSLQRSNGVILFTIPYCDFSASGISAVLRCALPALHEAVPAQRVSAHCPQCALQRGLRSSQAGAAYPPLRFRLHKPTAGRTKAIHRRLELSFNLYLLLLFVGQNRASKSLLHITPRISRFLQSFQQIKLLKDNSSRQNPLVIVVFLG